MQLKNNYPWLVVVAALALVLSACGGGAPATPPAEEPAAEATAAPEAPVANPL